jgi:tRNA A-37 threonylcarbamoyl transferase component Bud32
LMASEILQPVASGAFRGRISKDLATLLPREFLEGPASFIESRGGRILKDSRLRWAALFTLSDGKKVFCKRDRSKGWAEALKFALFGSKARNELTMALGCRAKGLPVPAPLGWLERRSLGLVVESWYLSEAIGDGVSLLDSAGAEGRVPLEPLARTVLQIHGAGLFHRDFHAGNFLRQGETLFLIDLHRARMMKKLSWGKRLWTLSQLLYSLHALLDGEDREAFVGHYLEAGHYNLEAREEVLQGIAFLEGVLQQRQWKSRTKRCLRESTEFTFCREEGDGIFRRRDFPCEAVQAAVDRHLGIVAAKGSGLLKEDRATCVSLFNEGERLLAVKQYRSARPSDGIRTLLGRGKARRAWVAGNGLRPRGEAGPGLLALVERRTGLTGAEGFLVMEAMEGGLELDRFLFRIAGDGARRRGLCRDLGAWLARLHGKGLYHRDLKTCNIFVADRDDLPAFRLLDLEDVRLDQVVDAKKVAVNLLQLHASTPGWLSRTDRLRFLKAYLAGSPLHFNRHKLIRWVLEKTRERGVVYVAPSGVVRERGSESKGKRA